MAQNNNLTAISNRSKATKIMCIMFVLLFMGNHIYGQSDHQRTFLGLGFGLDYGGFGGKVEYLPVKNFGLFGGLGFNLASVGWNVGATYKILPDKNVSPNLMLFYGYNAVLTVEGASEYDMTSYGITLGVNLDVKIGTKGNKWSFGLFVPIRSQKFMDNYDAVKKDPRIEIRNELIPIAFSVGYNFAIK